MKNIIIIILIAGFVTASTVRPRFQRLSVEMHSRTSAGGYTANSTTYYYYDTNGKLVTHLYDPSEVVMISNNKGEITVYDKKNNQVFQTQNPVFSAQHIQLMYFLEDQKHDLGLNKMGFNLADTRFEEEVMVTVWYPPMQLAKDVLKVELVHLQDNPIYMAYYDANENIAKKVYFYQYEDIYGVDMPTTITQIDFISPTDSIISKNTYKNFLIDVEANSAMFEFKVPEDAEIIKPKK